MKSPITLLFISILTAACTHQSAKNTAVTKPVGAVNHDTISKGDRDTVVIDSEREFKLAKHDLQELLKKEPSFNFHEGHYPDAPEIAYAIRQVPDFESELGQDIYYALYAHFLKKIHPYKKSAIRRQTLIKIYRDINYIFSTLVHGGTYFGHQHTRILADAEYSISSGEYSDCYDEKQYDISKQKQLYLNALKQQITDELNSNFEFLDKEKPKVKKELFEIVKELDNLITDYFYLENARTFQYANY
ncbi:hypothetical protein [Mucilaginibacter celer]|nr:hypothetical protein [Mucilaginibacter celer]